MSLPKLFIPLVLVALLLGQPFSGRTDTEIRLAKEQLKLTEDISEDKLMDWRFLKEVLGQK